LKLPAIELDRRTLLIAGGAGFGLVAAFALLPRIGTQVGAVGEQPLAAFLRIGTGGEVIVGVPQVENGQGIWTALPQVLADELGAAWEMVAVEPAPLDAAGANPLIEQLGWLHAIGAWKRWRLPAEALQITAGSTGVRAFFEPFRRAGAAARALLIAAAAEDWDVAPEECSAAGGFVICGARRAGFGQLAERAARRAPPEDPPLRAEPLLLGAALPRLDAPPKSDGSFRFAADVRLPDMLHASARLAPEGGRIEGGPSGGLVRGQGWVAAVADSWWAAEQALLKAGLRVVAPQRPDAAALDLLLSDALDNRALRTLFERGDYAAAVAGSRPLAATYASSPAPHYSLEPVSATVRFGDGQLELWTASQAPALARAAAAEAAGLGEHQIRLYPMPAGDIGGRALESIAAPIAVALAKRTGGPVQLTLSPSTSWLHDRPAPACLARLSALPAAGGGSIAAWRMRVATADGSAGALARLVSAAPPDALGPATADAAIPPYAISHVALAGAAVPMPFPPGYLRSEPHRSFAFFTESFVDELARIAGADPLNYRIAMLGQAPRLARCLSEAAARGGWDGGRPGSTLGLAAVSAFGSHLALLADARIGGDQAIAVDRLVAVVDCGRPINAGLIAQQVEAGLLWGLGQAVAPAPDFAAGLVRSPTIARLGLPRLAGTPRIEVHLVQSRDPPGGLSGLAPIALAPAVANAIAAGSGRRLRRLPLDPIAEA
jgi:isoquinoline 1-oxidoreductase subunit beta